MRKLIALTKFLRERLEASRSLSQNCTKQNSQKKVKDRRQPEDDPETQWDLKPVRENSAKTEEQRELNKLCI